MPIRTSWHTGLDHPIIALGVRVVAAGLSFAFGVVAARLLGVDEFGVVSVLLAVANVGMVFSLLGHEHLATREVAALRVSPDPRASKETLAYRRSASRQIWAASVAVLVVVVSVIYFLPISREAGLAYLSLLLLIPLIARTRLSQALIRGAHRASLAVVPDGIVRPGLALMGLIALGYAGAGVGFSFVAVMLASGLLALAIGRLWEERALKRRSGMTIEGQPNEPSANASFVGFSGTMYVSSILTTLASHAALISTGVLATSTDAGHYAAAEKLPMAAALIGQAVYLAIASHIASLHATGEIEQLRNLMRTVTRGVAGATLIACVIMALFAGPLLSLYGPGFPEAAPIMYLLLAAVLFDACAGPLSLILLMTKHERDHMRAMVAGVVVLVVLIIGLVPTYGALGAAWSVLVSKVVWSGLMLYYIKQRLALNPVLAWA